MTTEGVGFDADVVNCVMRKVPVARLDDYLQAMDERLVQREQTEDLRVSMLCHLFQGLCDGYFTQQAERLIRLMAERGLRVTAKNVSDLLASLNKQSLDYIRQATQLISIMPSLSLSPTISYWTNLASNVHSLDDASLILSHVHSLGVQGDAAFYFKLLEQLLALPATAASTHLPHIARSIFDRLEQQRLALAETDLLSLHLTAKMRKVVWLSRRLWTYLQTLKLPIAPRWLLIHAQHAALKADAAWLMQIALHLSTATDARQALAAAASGEGSTSPSSSSASGAAVWGGASAVYEELLTAQLALSETKQFTFRLWMQMRANGAEEGIGGKGKLYQALLRAVRARIQAGLTKEEVSIIAELLSAVRGEAAQGVPSVLTADMVGELEAALQRPGVQWGRGAQQLTPNGAGERPGTPLPSAPLPAAPRPAGLTKDSVQPPRSRHAGPPKRILRSSVSP